MNKRIQDNFIRIETICEEEVCLFNKTIITGNLNEIKRYIQTQETEIKILTKSSDKWFAKKIKQDEEFTKERNKLNNIIDTLITALAEERGIDEDVIREVFINE